MKRNKILIIVTSITAAILLFFFQYQFDNKYTFDSPVGVDGVLDLSHNFQSTNMLTYGWEIYEQKFIDSNDISQIKSDKIIYIGEYRDLGFTQDLPHGNATYHLKVMLPKEKQYYAMEVPEIYSASSIYINHDLLWKTGQLEPYHGHVHSGVIMFQASESIDITIQVADEEHYYSAIVYPFLFGLQDDIMHILNTRQMFRYMICTIALVVSLLTFILSFQNHENRYMYFLLSGFALCSGLYLAYPLYHLFGFSFMSYRIEDICYFIMIGCLIQIHCHLCHFNQKIKHIFMIITLLFVLGVMICPYFFYQNQIFMNIYSFIIDGYKCFLMGWIIVTAFAFIDCHTYTEKLWLSHICVFSTALFANVLFPLYEPVCTLYQVEIAMIYILITLSYIYIKESFQQVHDKTLLDNHLYFMQKQFTLLHTHYQDIQENIRHTKQLRHDYRHHLIIIQDDLNKQNYEHLSSYIQQLIQQSQNYTLHEYCNNHVFNAVLTYYDTIAQQKNMTLDYTIALPNQLNIPDWMLGSILGNLLENAIEACASLETSPTITIQSHLKDDHFILYIENPILYQPSQKDYYLSTKHDGYGIGIRSIQEIVESLNGEINIQDTPPSFKVQIIIW